MRRWFVTMCVMMGVLLWGGNQRARGENIELQVAALGMLNEFAVQPEQVKELRDIVGGMSGGPASPAASPAASDAGGVAYQTALQNLKLALVAGDGGKIAEAQASVDKMRATQNITPDTSVQITDQARGKATEALKLFTSSQLGHYLTFEGNRVPDATETILEAMRKSRGGADADFSALRDHAAEQVAMLAVGMDPTAGSPISQKVADLLTRARNMTDEEFATKQPDLAGEARAITNGIDPILALQHWMEHEMAYLLSNNETPAALDALAAPKSSQQAS